MTTPAGLHNKTHYILRYFSTDFGLNIYWFLNSPKIYAAAFSNVCLQVLLHMGALDEHFLYSALMFSNYEVLFKPLIIHHFFLMKWKCAGDMERGKMHLRGFENEFSDSGKPRET
jgi:hypothetical protein